MGGGVARRVAHGVHVYARSYISVAALKHSDRVLAENKAECITRTHLSISQLQ